MHGLTKAAGLAAGAGVGALGACVWGSWRERRRVDGLWDAVRVRGAGRRMDGAMTERLPEPARRYLERAIAPGTLLAGSAELVIDGRMRLGPRKGWMSFESEEVIGDGFVWRARTRRPPIVGFDCYVGGVGETAWRLLGVVPVAGARDADVARSARGRFVAELVFLPSALLPGPGVVWSGVDAEWARVTVTVDGEEVWMELRVGEDGGLLEMRMERWGDQGVETPRLQMFGARFGGMRDFGGVAVPGEVEVGWRPGAGDAFWFFEGEVREAVLY